MSVDKKKEIASALKSFAEGNLTKNALHLFDVLGYATDRQAPFSKKSPDEFLDNYLLSDSKFNEDKSLINSDWKYVDLLFQLTKEEVLKRTSLFDTKKVDNTVIETYLFFTIELKKESYTRTELSNITRAVNRLFPMPAMILFKHGSTLTFSIINRRLHKRDENKDVLEKVTLIKDISIASPHRAHVEILFDLSFDELNKEYQFSNFVELHNAWQKTLDIKELNNKFYKDLFDWYLWAVKSVGFPQIRPKEDLIDNDVRQSESVIRLLTRLLFCWFLKEKNQLIKDDLFNEEKLKLILKDFKGRKSKDTLYYRAIIQNLFFATLSVPIKERKYIRDKDSYPNKDYGNQYVFRFQDAFIDPKENLKLFKDIPFLNGGLFECLDVVPKSGDANRQEIRLDGFSTKENKQAKVPDFLFWGEHGGIDLSKELDNPKKNNVTVSGIIDILTHYKFTIEENTPIEEEIALDPELLGKVFENLLASYNPETKTTARKQTGSFYTPREIVNYMVDESLVVYLKNAMLDSAPGAVLIGGEQVDAFGNTARKGQLKIEDKVEHNP